MSDPSHGQGARAGKSPVLLVVCTANVCRSPVAAALLQRRLSHWTVMSAGIESISGQLVSAEMERLMMQRGIDLRHHRSQKLTLIHLQRTERVLVMTQGHLDEIGRRFPQYASKIDLLGHFQGAQIEDPMGLPPRFFEMALRQIEMATEAWANALIESPPA